MVLGDLDSYMHKNKTQSPTYSIHQNKFKMGKRIKYKSQHNKSPRGNVGRKISDIPHSNIFTDMSPRARDIKERINKWGPIKIKTFCMAKENSIKIKKETMVWEKVFANDTSDKGLISKICKELTQLNTRKTNNLIKKWAQTSIDTSPRST